MNDIPNLTIDRTIAGQTLYTAVQLAEQFNVSEATIRNRWFKWIAQVAPEALLKTGKKQYTELARELFKEFAQVEKCDRKQWVAEAKARYSHEWASAGVIEGELMPEAVGDVLALSQTQTANIELAVAQQLQGLEQLIDQVKAAEHNLSEAELKAAVARGQQRAVMLYQAELQAELQTTNILRQRRMGANDE